MPITRTQGHAKPHYYNTNNAQKSSSHNVIAQLQYADLWRGVGTLSDNGVMRVDMQGYIPGPTIQYNIQVQVNGVQGNSTVAHAILSSTIQTNDPANQRRIKSFCNIFTPPCLVWINGFKKTTFYKQKEVFSSSPLKTGNRVQEKGLIAIKVV